MGALVILAAGESLRLGTPKALVRLRDGEPSTPLAMLLAAGRTFFADPPLVVTGAHARETRAALHAGIELVENPDWKAGRLGGIALAVGLRPGVDLCLAPVDVPAVGSRVFAELADAWALAGAPARGWLAPSWTGRPEWIDDGSEPRKYFGHPVICGRELLEEVLHAERDMPLRGLRRRAQPLLERPVESDTILDDLDTPADLERIRKRFRDEPIPPDAESRR